MSFSCLSAEVLVQGDNKVGHTPALILYWDSWDSETKTVVSSSTMRQNETVLDSSLSLSKSSSVSAQNLPSPVNNLTPPSTPSIFTEKGKKKTRNSFI